MPSSRAHCTYTNSRITVIHSLSPAVYSCARNPPPPPPPPPRPRVHSATKLLSLHHSVGQHSGGRKSVQGLNPIDPANEEEIDQFHRSSGITAARGGNEEENSSSIPCLHHPQLFYRSPPVSVLGVLRQWRPARADLTRVERAIELPLDSFLFTTPFFPLLSFTKKVPSSKSGNFYYLSLSFLSSPSREGEEERKGRGKGKRFV